MPARQEHLPIEDVPGQFIPACNCLGGGGRQRRVRRGLRQAGRAGRPPKLTPTDIQWLKRALTAGPEAHGHAVRLWTLKRVAQLIATQFGVRYSQPRVWQILRKLGWSCQRPTGQARQRDEAAIRDWKRTQRPRLKKPPQPKAAPSSSSTSRA